MGNQKIKWTTEEEEALHAGVRKHGAGKWKNILKDDEFAPFLIHRSNIDLKDKWRNLSVNLATNGSKEKHRGSKNKSALFLPSPSPAVLVCPNASPAASFGPNACHDIVMVDASNSTQDSKNGPRSNAIIFEALATIRDMNGSEIGAILNFIEQRHEVILPPTYKRLLSAKLKRLVSQGKLEKVQNRYKIKTDATPTPAPSEMDFRYRKLQNSVSMSSAETVQDVADNAAYILADADNKSFLAAEAMKEAERISNMAENTESMLLMIKEIYDQCSRGEFVAVA